MSIEPSDLVVFDPIILGQLDPVELVPDITAWGEEVDLTLVLEELMLVMAGQSNVTPAQLLEGNALPWESGGLAEHIGDEVCFDLISPTNLTILFDDSPSLSLDI